MVIGGRVSGFHDPEVVGRSEVLKLMNAELVNRGPIGDRHNSVWNRVADVDLVRMVPRVSLLNQGENQGMLSRAATTQFLGPGA